MKSIEPTVGKKYKALISAGLASLGIGCLIETFIIRVVFSFLLFPILYHFQMSLLLNNDINTAKKGSKNKLNKNLLIYILGIMATVAILTFPSFDSPPDSQPLYLNITKIAFPSLLRVLSGYFIMGVLPGYVILNAFLFHRKFDIIERVGLTLALSCTANLFLGFLLLSLETAYFSSQIFMLALWSFLGVAIIIGKYLRTKSEKAREEQEFSGIVKRHKMLFLYASLLILISSYMLVLSSDIADPALEGDITRYIAYANMLKLGRSAKYLSDRPLFYMLPLVAQLLTGLHPFIAYAGLQFLLLMLPTSVYIAIKSVSKNGGKAPVIGMLLASLTFGFGFIGIIDFFSKYVSGGSETYSALINMWNKSPIGFWSYQFYVIPFSYSILFIALAFAFKCFMRKEHGLSNALLSGLFAAQLPFLHGIFEFSFFVVALVIYLLFFAPLKNALKSAAVLVCSLTLFFTLLEVMTGLYRYTFINFYFHFEHFYGYPQPSLQPLVILLITIVILSSFSLRFLAAKIKILLSERFVNILFVRLTFWFLAIILPFLAIYCWRVEWPTLNVRVLEWLPWYVYALCYGLCPTVIVGMIPAILKRENNAALQVFISWLLSVSVLTILSIVYPYFFTPMVWGRRWLYFAYYPLVALASLAIENMFKPSSGLTIIRLSFEKFTRFFRISDTKFLKALLLAFLISFSTLSCAYTTELFYVGATMQKNISDGEADAYKWILKNLPEDARILTISDVSKGRLQSLALRKAYAYSDAKVSWPIQVLFNSYLPEVTLYSLKQLGISYFFLSPRDSSLLGEIRKTYFNSLLNIAPVVYKNKDVTLYAMPSYPIREKANYILVSPTLDFQNITVLEQKLIFSDEFKATLENWVIISGDWRIENEELHALGTKTVGYWADIVSNKSFANFVFEYKAKSMQTTDPKYVWGIFRYLDEKNFYSFYIGNTTFELFERVAGEPNRLAGGRLKEVLNLTDWHTVKVEAVYSTVKLYVDDKLITAVQGTGLEGRVGLKTLVNYRTAYDDIKVYSLKLPVDMDSALKNYQFTFNMLLASRINFTTVSDIDLVTLETGKVYVFPSNQHLPENIASAVQKYISEGTYVLFIDSLFGAYNELYEENNPILHSMLGLKKVSPVACSGVSFEAESIDLNGTYLISKLITGQTPEVNILANFVGNGQPQTAYIVYRQIGDGIIAYMHLTDIIKNAGTSFPYNTFFEESINQIMSILPSPVGKEESSLPLFPSGLYKFLQINDVPALISLEDIYGYVYAYGSPIEANGSIRIQSNYTLVTSNQVKIGKLEASSINNYFLLENETLLFVNIRGSVELSLETTSFLLSSPYYVGEIVTFSVPGNTTLYIKLINAELSFKRSQDNEETTITEGEIKITISSLQQNSIKITLRQPLIEVNGNLRLTSWQGIFWYNDKAIIMFSPHSSTVKGALSLQFLYQFGGNLIKIIDVESVHAHEVIKVTGA